MKDRDFDFPERLQQDVEEAKRLLTVGFVAAVFAAVVGCTALVWCILG